MKRGTRNAERGNVGGARLPASRSRRQFIRRGALFLPTLFLPRLIRAQSTLTAEGLAAFGTNAPSGGGGGGGDITTGLVAHYALDDNAASTAVADSSGNGYNGTASTNTSTLHATGHVGTGAFLLNGSSQYVNLVKAMFDVIAGGTECTLACWFKGSLIQSAMRFQVQNANYILLGYGTTSPVCAISTDGGVASGVAITGAQDGNWHHVAMTWKKNTTNGFKVYVDAAVSAQRNSANVNLPVTDNTFPPILGRYGGGSEYTNGTIDDAFVFSRALTATDIATLYALT